MGRWVWPELERRGMVAVLLLAAACGRAPNGKAEARVLDTATMGRIAGLVGQGLRRLAQDSGRGIVDLIQAGHANPRADEIAYLIVWAHVRLKDTSGVARWLDSLAAWKSCLVPPPDIIDPMTG